VRDCEGNEREMGDENTQERIVSLGCCPEAGSEQNVDVIASQSMGVH
jgi:hypothetical protein